MRNHSYKEFIIKIIARNKKKENFKVHYNTKEVVLYHAAMYLKSFKSFVV